MSNEKLVQYRDKLFDRADILGRLAWDRSMERRKDPLPIDSDTYIVLADTGMRYGIEDSELIDKLDFLFNDRKSGMKGLTAAFLIREIYAERK